MTRTATRPSSVEMSGAFGRVATFVHGDAEELQAVADAAAGLGRVLADSAGEDQGIQAAERRRQRPDAGLGPVAEQLDSLGGPDVDRPAGTGGREGRSWSPRRRAGRIRD